jgi:hypothetical protein
METRLARRIFGWFIIALLTLTLILFCWLAVVMIRYPTSRDAFVVGWVMLVLSTLPLANLGWWFFRRSRSGHGWPDE